MLRLKLKRNLIYVCKGACITSAIIAMPVYGLSKSDSAVSKRKDVHGQERNVVFNVYITVLNKLVI